MSLLTAVSGRGRPTTRVNVASVPPYIPAVDPQDSETDEDETDENEEESSFDEPVSCLVNPLRLNVAIWVQL